MRPVVTLTTLTICLSFSLIACAGLTIKTWYLDAQLKKLVRRDSAGNIREIKELIDADGYRCYSRIDDEAWRKEYSSLSACCNQKQ